MNEKLKLTGGSNDESFSAIGIDLNEWCDNSTPVASGTSGTSATSMTSSVKNNNDNNNDDDNNNNCYPFEMARKQKRREDGQRIGSMKQDELTCHLTSNAMKNEKEVIETAAILRKRFNKDLYHAFKNKDNNNNSNNKDNVKESKMNGTFGFVEKAFSILSGNIVAITSSRGSQEHFTSYKSFLKEVFLLKEFQYCQYISDLLDCGLDNENNGDIALEYMNLSSLNKYWKVVIRMVLN